MTQDQRQNREPDLPKLPQGSTPGIEGCGACRTRKVSHQGVRYIAILQRPKKTAEGILQDFLQACRGSRQIRAPARST
jgi:hypothetical protein